jgi:hypothetical protein
MIRGDIRRAFRLALRRRDRWEHEVEDEIKLHLTLRAEHLMAQGASADDASREAVRRFGPLTESRARLLEAARHREAGVCNAPDFSPISVRSVVRLRTLGRQKADRGHDPDARARHRRDDSRCSVS